RLIDLKLETLAAAEEAGFGFEAVGLAVTDAERMAARQNELIMPSSGYGRGGDDAEDCALLIDTLRQRLGPRSVRSFEPVASHLPERAEKLSPVTISFSPGELRMGELREGTNGAAVWPEPAEATRPLLLLPQAEPTEVMALIPDGPPRRFRWRGITYEVAGA